MKTPPWRQFAGSSFLARSLLMGIGKQAPASQSTDMLVASYQCEGETQESVAPSSFLFQWFRELQRYTAGKCHRFKSRLPADAENPRLPFSGPFGVNLPEGLCMCLIKHWGKPKIFSSESTQQRSSWRERATWTSTTGMWQRMLGMSGLRDPGKNWWVCCSPWLDVSLLLVLKHLCSHPESLWEAKHDHGVKTPNHTNTTGCSIWANVKLTFKPDPHLEKINLLPV